ncbi:MAG: hypothetical protein AB1393_12945, partial [Candidatus Edwardsbacteria bacterium]
PPGRPSALPRGRQGVVVKAKQAYIIVPEGFQADFEPKFNKALSGVKNYYPKTERTQRIKD